VTAQGAGTELAVGYAVPMGELSRGAIERLHPVHPATGLSWCGKALSIAWTGEDARGSQADCPACLQAIGLEAGR